MTLEQLTEIRIQGEIPEGLILLSLVGALEPVSNPVVYLKTGDSDYRVFIGLDVEIIHNGMMISFIINLIDKLIESGISTLSLTNIEDGKRTLAVWHGNKDITDITNWPTGKREVIKKCDS